MGESRNVERKASQPDKRQSQNSHRGPKPTQEYTALKRGKRSPFRNKLLRWSGEGKRGLFRYVAHPRGVPNLKRVRKVPAPS